MFYILFTFACLNFSNDFDIDNDNDGFSEYDGDCDDNDGNIGVLECTDDDGDGFSEYQGDCDDTEPLTFPGAAELDSTEECLTDWDEDGYGAITAGYYEAAISDCITISISDSFNDGCDGTVDLYVDGAWYTSYEGPSAHNISYEDCGISGDLWVGWTKATSFNYECSFEILDSTGATLYTSESGPDALAPGSGTDSDDMDASVQ